MPEMPGMDMPARAQKGQTASPSPTASHPKPAADTSTGAMDNMDMGDMDHSGSMPSMPGMKPPTDLITSILSHSASGSSAEPASTPTPMLMRTRGQWMLMLHGMAFVGDTQQQATPPASFPAYRGADKLFSTNWIMPMAMRDLGHAGHAGQLTLRTMLSLEPATITGRQYPELFQQGETAFGKPIVDGQHPHDFFMEVAALYDLRLGHHALLSLYAAPVGDPAIGPTAYPHRLSASEDPIAALGHHQEDSTHIAFSVLTGGLTFHSLRFEQSGFHGAEPNEGHWRFQPSPNGLAIDSYASRLTFAPTRDLAAQYSWAHITAPEALYPHEDQARQTASVMYNRPFGRDLSAEQGSGVHSGNLSSTLLWGRTRSLAPGHQSPENSYLLEGLLRFRTRNYVWTRLENAGRSNELLLTPGTSLPPGFEENPIGHVAAYTAGYDLDFKFTPHLLVAPGAQFTSYITPSRLTSIYGTHPYGVVAFVRFRLIK